MKCWYGFDRSQKFVWCLMLGVSIVFIPVGLDLMQSDADPGYFLIVGIFCAIMVLDSFKHPFDSTTIWYRDIYRK